MRQALLFSVADETFALPLGSVREVVRAAWPRPSPRAPFGCLGLLDLHGQLVPLLDLGPLLGLRRPLPAAQLELKMLDCHVLVVELKGMTVSLLVDRVLDVGDELGAPGPDEGRSLAMLGRAASMVDGVAEAGGKRGLLLSPEALINLQRQRLLQRTLEGARGASAG
jgi:chemotaxis signal transduction protein